MGVGSLVLVGIGVIFFIIVIIAFFIDFLLGLGLLIIWFIGLIAAIGIAMSNSDLSNSQHSSFSNKKSWEDTSEEDRQRSNDIKNTLYGKQSGFCNGCKNHYMIKDLEVDHIKSRSSGGKDVDDNLQLLCGSCNRIKGDRDMLYLRSKLERDTMD